MALLHSARFKTPGFLPETKVNDQSLARHEGVPERHDGARRRLDGGREGRVRLYRRRFGFGKVDDDPPPSQGGRGDKGRHIRGGQERGQAHRVEGAAPAPEHRHRLPGLQAAAGQDGVRERRVRARGDWQDEERHRPARSRDPRSRRSRRRADRQPRPQHLRRHHAAPRQGQPDRDHHRHGHARPGDRRRHAPASHRAGEGQGRSGSGPRGLQLMAKLDYFFRETTSGLRRNGLVAFAAISTTFIALLLFGLALLISRQVNIMIDRTTGNVEVAIYLSDPVNDQNVASLRETLMALPIVATVDYENKQEAYERFQDLFANSRELVDNVDPEALPASLRVKLSEAERFQEVAAVLGCEPGRGGYVCAAPGVETLVDQREFLDRLFAVTRVFRVGVLLVAIVMLVSAAVLIANTVRMGLFARRKEIGIMKLVGATNWRIRIPFLIEGLFESLIGAVAAILVLFALKVAFINPLNNSVQFVPWIVNRDVLAIVPWLLFAGVLVAIVAGLVGMRRFLDV